MSAKLKRARGTVPIAQKIIPNTAMILHPVCKLQQPLQQLFTLTHIAKVISPNGSDSDKEKLSNYFNRRIIELIFLLFINTLRNIAAFSRDIAAITNRSLQFPKGNFGTDETSLLRTLRRSGISMTN